MKYNHLVANCVIFYNVFAMSQALQGLEASGAPVSDAVLAALSPYLTAHINRLGRYDGERWGWTTVSLRGRSRHARNAHRRWR